MQAELEMIVRLKRATREDESYLVMTRWTPKAVEMMSGCIMTSTYGDAASLPPEERESRGSGVRIPPQLVPRS